MDEGARKEMTFIYTYNDPDGTPTSECLYGCDLTKKNAIEVHFKVNGKIIRFKTHLVEGVLQDTPDGLAGKGFLRHVWCRKCSELLTDLDIEEFIVNDHGES